jgi:predicted DCC family thiol-disulfide oxidoreductase YuxK
MHDAPHSSSQTLEVWMDGECGVCRASQAWCELRDTDGRMQFRDFRTADAEQLPVSRDEHESSMWVRGADGRMLRGFEAWRLIMASLPGWRWLAMLTGLPPLRWLGEPLYRLVARNRHRLPWPRGDR